MNESIQNPSLIKENEYLFLVTVLKLKCLLVFFWLCEMLLCKVQMKL